MNPNVHLATRTINLIDKAIEADQGNSYRSWLQKVLPTISDAYRQDEDTFRSHLGGSQLGNECVRSIYYSYRWFTNKRYEGRIIRLFNRGHMEEARFIACLLTIGVEVYQQDSNGDQFRITHANGHMGGAIDGVGIKIPDLAADQPALLEFKTHGEKSFNLLKDDGVRESKPEHYTQVQVYMRKMGLAVCLYLAVNKNTDELYGEIIPLNAEHADANLDKGEVIINLPLPPKRISESSGYFKCRMCEHRPICHLRVQPPKNCRTCINSKPLPDGTWTCILLNKALSTQDQMNGCPDHNPIAA